jgi:hypothetical protein
MAICLKRSGTIFAVLSARAAPGRAHPQRRGIALADTEGRSNGPSFSTTLDLSFLNIVLSGAPLHVHAVALGPSRPRAARLAQCATCPPRLVASASWEVRSPRAEQRIAFEYGPNFPSNMFARDECADAARLETRQRRPRIEGPCETALARRRELTADFRVGLCDHQATFRTAVSF